jgi:predicted extracellular nuclease
MSRILLLALLATLAVASPATAAVPNGPSPDLVISEVYGGGGNAGSDYAADYVELFNRGTATASLAGKSLQYASATGTGAFGSVTTLSGDVAPGQYVLVQASGGAVTADITL